MTSVFRHILGRHQRSPVWSDLAPVRDELFGPERLEHHARSLAAAQPDTPRPRAVLPLHARLNDNATVLLAAYRASATELESGRSVVPAAEWLLDNYHTIAETYRHLTRDLSPAFLRSLPRGQFQPVAEPIPRVLALAWDYAAMTDGDLRERSFADFIAGAQQVDWLTIGELWSLPSMLRYALLLRMLRLSDETERARRGRREANAAMDRLMAMDEPGPADFDQAVPGPALQNAAFVAQVIYRVHAGLDRTHAITEQLARRLAAQGRTAEQVMAGEQTRQTANNVTAAHIIRALKRLDEINWREWFEATSRTEAILREDPDHQRLAPQTRNAIRNRIEMIARHSALAEPEVAERALAAAGRRDIPVSVVLLGDDAPRFEADCGYRPVWRERLARLARRHGILSLILPLAALMLLAVVLCLTYVPAQTGGFLAATLIVLSLAAFLDAGLALLRFVASRLIAPAQLPAYGFKDGIPPDHATLVAIPCLLTSLDTIDDLLSNLEVHYLANPDPALSFALLTDFTDAAEETTPRDAELLAYARQGIAALAEADFPSVRGKFRFGPNQHPIQDYYVREVVREGDVLTNKIIGPAMTDHGDAYAEQCKM